MKFSSKTHTSGFTLIELLIVISIVGIISVGVLATYRDYDSQTLLRNTAYEVALSVREAQILGISTSPYGDTSDEGAFERTYGLHFEENSSVYYVFVDLNGNEAFDATDATIKTVRIANNIMVSGICVVEINDTDCESVDSADVTFRRPHLRGIITTSPSSLDPDRVEVTLRSAKGNERQVQISHAGRISVE